jgi:hypothetical protein
MSATTTRRTSRKSAPANEVPENLKDAPAPTKVIRRRPTPKPSAPAAPVAEKPATPRRRPAPVVDVSADALIPQASRTILSADGSMIRHTQDYTVDLMDEGSEPERDYSKVLAKSPSEVHLDYVAWVEKYVGVKIDARTVQILISTYHEFQATPAQKAKTIQKRLAAAEKRAEAAKNKAKKAAAAKVASAAKVEDAKK